MECKKPSQKPNHTYSHRQLTLISVVSFTWCMLLNSSSTQRDKKIAAKNKLGIKGTCSHTLSDPRHKARSWTFHDLRKATKEKKQKYQVIGELKFKMKNKIKHLKTKAFWLMLSQNITDVDICCFCFSVLPWVHANANQSFVVAERALILRQLPSFLHSTKHG